MKRPTLLIVIALVSGALAGGVVAAGARFWFSGDGAGREAAAPAMQPRGAGAFEFAGARATRAPAETAALEYVDYGPRQVSVGTYSSLAHIALPAGKFVVTAKALFHTNRPPPLAAHVNCSLVAGADFDQARFLVNVPDEHDLGNGGYTPVAFILAHAATQPSALDLLCKSLADPDAGTAKALQIMIIVQRVEQLTQIRP